MTWQIPERRNRIAVTLLEAAEKVDRGVIYVKEWLEFEDNVLAGELRREQAGSIVRLYKKFADEYSQILEQALEQVGDESFNTRRDETDSELGPMQTLEAQFDLLRVIDNQRYPVFFYLNGQSYLLQIEKEEPFKMNNTFPHG